MSCPPTPQIQRQIADLTGRVCALERSLEDYRTVTGVITTPEETIVSLMSITPVTVGSGTVYTLVFPSWPGEIFQIQESHELPEWTDVASPIAAAAAPATSTAWVSGSYSMDDIPVYFRVRKFPVLLSSCPPAAPCTCPA